MAKEESVRTFSKTAQGGSPYLQSFIQPAEQVQTAQFERALQMERADREQQSFDAAQARALRQEEFQNKELEYRQKAEDRRLEAANLALRKQDTLDALKLAEDRKEVDAAAVAGQIELLDDKNPEFGNNLKKIITENAGVFTTKYSKFPMEKMKEKQQTHDDYIGWLSTTAKENGYSGNVYDLPKNKDGQFDTTANGLIFGPKGVFTTSFAQKQVREATDLEKRIQNANLKATQGISTKIPMGNGEVMNVEAQKPVKAVDQKKEDLAFKERYGVPASVFSVPMGKSGSTTKVRGSMENGRFVENEEGDQILFKDNKDSKLKGGKTMPYSIYLEEEDKRKGGAYSNGSGVGMQGGTAFFSSPSPTSLPQTETEATTPAQQTTVRKYNVETGTLE